MASRRRRILPDAAYDFFAFDVRDGEMGPRRGTAKTARKDAREMRQRYRASGGLFPLVVIEMRWNINEVKVHRLLERSRAR